MKVSVSSEFQQQIKKLTKKPKLGYNSCIKDIYEFIAGQTPDSLFAHPIKWYERNNWRIVKTYLKNSGQNLSAKNGFRLIYAYNLHEKALVLLFLFPKRGSLSAQNLTDKEKQNLIISFFNQLENENLILAELEKNKLTYITSNK